MVGWGEGVDSLRPLWHFKCHGWSRYCQIHFVMTAGEVTCSQAPPKWYCFVTKQWRTNMHETRIFAVPYFGLCHGWDCPTPSQPFELGAWATWFCEVFLPKLPWVDLIKSRQASKFFELTCHRRHWGNDCLESSMTTLFAAVFARCYFESSFHVLKDVWYETATSCSMPGNFLP